MSRLSAHDVTRLWRMVHELHALLLPLVMASTSARQNEHLRRSHNGPARLPSRLSGWIQKRVRTFPASARLPSIHEPLVVGVAGRRLVVRFTDGPGGPILHLTEEHRPVSPGALATWRLTGRETEVLRWLVEGKTNAEIARILASQPRTVDKHCERIYQKLGVENRTAAVRQALDGSLGGPARSARAARKKRADS